MLRRSSRKQSSDMAADPRASTPDEVAFSSAGGDLTTRAGSFTTPRPAAPRGVSFERVPCSLHSTH
jgi:hypothetical protein